MSRRTAFRDQAKAAVAEARRDVAGAFGLPDEPAPRGVSPFFDELWDRHGQSRRCSHLSLRPLQPWHLFPADGVWRCKPCQGMWAATRKSDIAARRPFLDPVEEFTCDRCRRFSPGGLEPAVVRQDFWVIVVGLCGRCFARVESEGGRVVAP